MPNTDNDGSAYDHPTGHSDDTLTRVGRGTPMGEMLRRYWHPVYKSDKLTDRPVRVTVLGEDVILFRRPRGDVGAVYPRCIHRGTSLYYGKVTDDGIRCGYHGWTFDTEGHCLDRPTEPNHGGNGRGAYRQPWYPVEERYGLAFIYMGPLDRKPALPRHDALEHVPDGWEIYADDTTKPSAGAGYMPCNWLQHHENGLDAAHVTIVHQRQFPDLMLQAMAPGNFKSHITATEDRIEDHGVTRFAGIRGDLTVQLILPNIRAIPDPILPIERPDGKINNLAWTVPIDDTNTIVFTAYVHPTGTDIASTDAGRIYDGKLWTEMTPEEHQLNPGDFETQTGQGEITFHSEEHLVASDKGIIMLRRLLRSAVDTVAAGGNPPLAFGAGEVYIETPAAFRVAPDPDFVPQDAAATPA
jgi:nitrite reductase/ring-hydroxylating ferredoxin subunit